MYFFVFMCFGANNNPSVNFVDTSPYTGEAEKWGATCVDTSPYTGEAVK